MKKFYSFALLALTMGFVFVSCDDEKEDGAKSYTLSMSLSKTDSAFISTDTTNNIGYYYKTSLQVGQFQMVHGWSPYWGFGGGFTYSSCTDDTTALNSNMSAITKKGVKTNTYFIAYTGSEYYGLPVEITFKGGKAFNAKEVYVTNSTSAYLAIKEGKDEYGSVKKWTDSDKFTLTITGYFNAFPTGKIEFLLADGLNIVDTWQQIDLSKLGQVTKISFSISSTDQMTPSYFCLDQLTVTE